MSDMMGIVAALAGYVVGFGCAAAFVIALRLLERRDTRRRAADLFASSDDWGFDVPPAPERPEEERKGAR